MTGTCKDCGGPYAESFSGARETHLCDRCARRPARPLPQSAPPKAVEVCEHRTQIGIMKTRRCTRPAVKDGYCARHHWSYESPSQRKALAALAPTAGEGV